MWIRVLEKETGKSLEYWNAAVKALAPGDPDELETWLAERCIQGYASTLLRMEFFGYPDFLSIAGPKLLELQFQDRIGLRPIYDAIIEAAAANGVLIIQHRKSYTSLVTPRRTFARIRPTSRKRVDLGLRLEEHIANDRLLPSRMHPTMKWELRLHSLEEWDTEAVELLAAAYRQNC